MTRYGSSLNRIIGLVYLCVCGSCAGIFYYAEATTDYTMTVGGVDIPWGLGWIGIAFSLAAISGLRGLLGHAAVLARPLRALEKKVVADGIVDAEEVAKIRERLYADNVIDREEADFLFAVNDRVSGNANDPGWKGLFVDALTAHVLEDEVSPGEVDDDETDYLISKIEADGKVDDVELALLVNIVSAASKTTEKLQQFVLSSLKASVLADGVIDAEEVAMIRQVIYGSGSGAGEGVDRAEADFLFELNDAVTGKENDPGWQDLLVEAITKHVLEDEVSPGEVDDDEAAWLIQKVEADGQMDDAEKAILASVKAKAEKIADSLKAKMDSWDV